MTYISPGYHFILNHEKLSQKFHTFQHIIPDNIPNPDLKLCYFLPTSEVRMYATFVSTVTRKWSSLQGMKFTPSLLQIRQLFKNN